MKNKEYRILLSLMMISVTAGAQQLTQLSQYLQNHFVINPAAMGVNNEVDLNLSFRQQWVGFDNAPQTYYFSGHTIIGRNDGPKYNPSLRTSSQRVVKAPTVKTGKLKHSVGGNVMMDKYGPWQRISGNAAYAIHVPLSQGMNLACGVGLGMANLGFDESKAQVLSGNDATYDAFIGSGNQRQNMFDLNTGLYLYSQYLFAGYSTSQVFQNKVSFGDVTNAKLKTHHYLMAGYRIYMSEDWSITPNVLVKYMNPSPVAVDMNARIDYLDKYFFGFSYRHKDAVVGVLGINLNGFKLGYSYDFTISTLRKQNSGGHEIIVGYKWAVGKK